MDLKEIILEYCNPVSTNDLIRILNIFEDLDYDGYMDDIYDKVEESVENDSNNVGRLISNLIINHAYTVLLELGITLSKEIEDVTIREIREILSFNLLLEYSDKDKADEILNTLEVNEDIVSAYSEILAKYTELNYTRAYQLVENIDLGYLTSLTEVLTKISDGETDSIFNYNVINVIKDLRVTENSEILGLRIIRNDYGEEKTFEDLVRNNIDKSFNQDIKVTAVNIMSLLILGIDSRFDRLKMYTEYFEDLIEDEYYKMELFKELKTLDVKVEKLYITHEVGKDLNGDN